MMLWQYFGSFSLVISSIGHISLKFKEVFNVEPYKKILNALGIEIEKDCIEISSSSPLLSDIMVSLKLRRELTLKGYDVRSENGKLKIYNRSE